MIIFNRITSAILLATNSYPLFDSLWNRVLFLLGFFYAGLAPVQAQHTSSFDWDVHSSQEIWLANISTNEVGTENISNTFKPVWLNYTGSSISHSWSFNHDISLDSYLSAFYTNGSSISEYVGELQSISNIEASTGVELLEAWFTLGLSGTLQIKSGILDSNANFDSIEPAQFFINSSHGIGPDFSSVGMSGPSIFPETGLGAIIFYGTDNWSLKLGGFDPTPHTPSANNNLSELYQWRVDDGALLVSEFIINVSAIHFGVGLWGSSYDQTLIYSEFDNLKNVRGFYGYVHRNDTFGSTYLRLGVSESSTAYIDRYVGAGWVKKLNVEHPSFSENYVGISLASARLGELGYYSEFGTEIGSSMVHPFEHIVELSSISTMFDHFTIQPNLQMILQPGARTQDTSHFLLGLRGTWEL